MLVQCQTTFVVSLCGIMSGTDRISRNYNRSSVHGTNIGVHPLWNYLRWFRNAHSPDSLNAVCTAAEAVLGRSLGFFLFMCSLEGDVPAFRPSPSISTLTLAYLIQIPNQSTSESGLLIEVANFFPSNVAFLSSLCTKLAEIWYTFNLT